VYYKKEERKGFFSSCSLKWSAFHRVRLVRLWEVVSLSHVLKLMEKLVVYFTAFSFKTPKAYIYPICLCTLLERKRKLHLMDAYIYVFSLYFYILYYRSTGLVMHKRNTFLKFLNPPWDRFYCCFFVFSCLPRKLDGLRYEKLNNMNVLHVWCCMPISFQKRFFV